MTVEEWLTSIKMEQYWPDFKERVMTSWRSSRTWMTGARLAAQKVTPRPPLPTA
jgi:hypothetical protein